MAGVLQICACFIYLLINFIYTPCTNAMVNLLGKNLSLKKSLKKSFSQKYLLCLSVQLTSYASHV